MGFSGMRSSPPLPHLTDFLTWPLPGPVTKGSATCAALTWNPFSCRRDENASSPRSGGLRHSYRDGSSSGYLSPRDGEPSRKCQSNMPGPPPRSGPRRGYPSWERARSGLGTGDQEPIGRTSDPFPPRRKVFLPDVRATGLSVIEFQRPRIILRPLCDPVPIPRVDDESAGRATVGVVVSAAFLR